MTTIEQELREYILDNHGKIGRPPNELSGHQSDDLIVDEDESLDKTARNAELILDYFGIGGLIWPTYQELADVYEGIESRQRVAQIIKDHYLMKAPNQTLPIAAAVTKILESRTFWFEGNFLQELVLAGLTDEIKSAKQLLIYLSSQGLAEEYEVYQTDLKPVTRNSYIDFDERIILTKTRKPQLEKLYLRSRKIVGQNGLCRLSHVNNEISEGDARVLRGLIHIHKESWTIESDGVFWYAFEDRQNTLVNNARKVFSVVNTCDAETLSRLLINSLKARTSPVKEYPDQMIVNEWIYSSDCFQILNKTVSLKRTALGLNEIETDISKLMRGQGAMSSADLLNALKQIGYREAHIRKNIYNSSLIDIDRSGGARNYKFTLISDNIVNEIEEKNDPYEIVKAQLAELEELDVPRDSKQRREQSLLRKWLFGDLSHSHCAICNREFSIHALITAHKKKRSRCSNLEKRDPHIVFPLCLFGCDYLYEHGFISVSEGVIVSVRRPTQATEAQVISGLIGKKLSERWLKGPASFFDNVS